MVNPSYLGANIHYLPFRGLYYYYGRTGETLCCSCVAHDPWKREATTTVIRRVLRQAFICSAPS